MIRFGFALLLPEVRRIASLFLSDRPGGLFKKPPGEGAGPAKSAILLKIL